MVSAIAATFILIFTLEMTAILNAIRRQTSSINSNIFIIGTGHLILDVDQLSLSTFTIDYFKHYITLFTLHYIAFFTKFPLH